MELTLFVDHQCNLRCTYCYNGEKFTRAMDAATMRKAVDLALQQQIRHLDVSFFGGEPMMRPAIVQEAVAYAEQAVAAMQGQKPTLRFLMNTNGTLIDDAALELMAPPRSWTAFVSLDGAKPVHDRFRVHGTGKGSFDDVMAGVDRLRSRGIPFQLVAVVSTETAPFLGETVRTLLPLGATKVVLAPNFRDEWTEASVDALRLGLQDAGRVWAEEFRRGTAIALEPLHTKILTHLKGGIPCPSRCMIGGTEFTVTPSGRIYPCAQMVGEDTADELVIGTIETGLSADRIKALQTAKDQVEDTCATCALRDRCQSHCGCRHVALSGKLGVITATLCEVESAFIDAADQVAEALYEEKCEAFLDYYYRKEWNAARGGVLTQLRKSRDA